MTAPECMNAARQIAMADPDDFEDALGYLLGFATSSFGRQSRRKEAPSTPLSLEALLPAVLAVELGEVSGPLRNNGSYLVRKIYGADAWVAIYQGDDLMEALLTMARYRSEHDPDFSFARSPGDLAAYAAALAEFVARQEATAGRPNVQRLIEAVNGCADLIRNGGNEARVAFEGSCYNADEVYGSVNVAASLVRFAGEMVEHAFFMLEYGHSNIEVYRQAIDEVLREAVTCSSTPIQRVHAAWRVEQIRESLGTILANGMPKRSTVSDQDWRQAVKDLKDLFSEVTTQFFNRFGSEEIDIALSPSDPRLDLARSCWDRGGD